LAACSIHHALSAIASGVILLSYCIHPDFLLFRAASSEPIRAQNSRLDFSSYSAPSPRRQVRQDRGHFTSPVGDRRAPEHSLFHKAHGEPEAP
jgi:hypothetical protein